MGWIPYITLALLIVTAVLQIAGLVRHWKRRGGDR